MNKNVSISNEFEKGEEYKKRKWKLEMRKMKIVAHKNCWKVRSRFSGDQQRLFGQKCRHRELTHHLTFAQLGRGVSMEQGG